MLTAAVHSLPTLCWILLQSLEATDETYSPVLKGLPRPVEENRAEGRLVRMGGGHGS